jgi:drug/metabolite transporter (DMT)-like permease
MFVSYALCVSVVLLFFCSNLLVGYIQAESSYNYKDSLMISTIGLLVSACLIFGFFRDCSKDLLRRAVPLGPIGLISSATYNTSYGYKHHALTITVTSTGSAFAVFFEWWMLGKKPSFYDISAAVVSFIGCTVAALSLVGNTDESKGLTGDSDVVYAFILALVSACFTGLYTVMIIKNELEKSSMAILPIMSLSALSCSPFLFVGKYIMEGSDNFVVWPILPVVGLSLLNGLIGLIAGYFTVKSLEDLSPVVYNVVQSLLIPLTVIEELHSSHAANKLGVLFYTGTAIVVLSAAIPLLGQKYDEPEQQEQMPLREDPDDMITQIPQNYK